MHPTIARMMEIVAKGDEAAIAEILADEVAFLPPTYWATWTGRAPVAAVLGHVGRVFEDFRYRRVMGEGCDWALEFECHIGELDAVGVDLITLDEEGLIVQFEVVMRPVKTVALLKERMLAAVSQDLRFLKFRQALS